MQIAVDARPIVTVLLVILAIAGGLALRGWLRFFVLVGGLLLAAYVAGLMPAVPF